MPIDWLTPGAGIISAGLGAIGSAYAAKKAYKYQSALMDKQYNLTRQLNQNAYQDTTSSMRAAGINPMLAITQGINGLSAGSGGSVSVDNPANAAMSSASTALEMRNAKKLADSQLEVNDSQYHLNSANERAIREQGENTRIQNWLLDKFGAAKQQAEIAQVLNNMKNQDKLTNAQVNNLLITASSSAKSAQANYINATQGNAWRTGVDVSKKFIKSLPKNKVTNYLNSLIAQ